MTETAFLVGILPITIIESESKQAKDVVRGQGHDLPASFADQHAAEEHHERLVELLRGAQLSFQVWVMTVRKEEKGYWQHKRTVVN